MEPIIETGSDVVTVISDGASLTFATRKEWGLLADADLEELTNYRIIMAFKGKGKGGTLYLLLHTNNPHDMFTDRVNCHLLAKILQGDDGKQHIFCMSISAAEAQQLCKNRLTLWD